MKFRIVEGKLETPSLQEMSKILLYRFDVDSFPISSDEEGKAVLIVDRYIDRKLTVPWKDQEKIKKIFKEYNLTSDSKGFLYRDKKKVGYKTHGGPNDENLIFVFNKFDDVSEVPEFEHVMSVNNYTWKDKDSDSIIVYPDGIQNN